MRVLVAMSGGVDSSVAAALLLAEGHEVVGVTMKLWAGPSDAGCCSVADVDDARRVAQQLGIDHLVFNFSSDFDARVVEPYVEAHRAGRTPNPCIDCNRHLKFDRLVERADLLGFDAVATGHHCRVGQRPDGELGVGRGVDLAKDQSYVVHVLDQRTLARCRFPVGALTKAQVRAEAARLGLRTAGKPDSQDVCFVSSEGGRARFLADRIAMHAGRVVDADGLEVGSVPAIELVTLGQRRGLGLPGGGDRAFATSVDMATATVTVGRREDLLCSQQPLEDLAFSAGACSGPVRAQCSAHGTSAPGVLELEASGPVLRWSSPQRRVAPGQSVVLYDLGDEWVLGGAIAAA